MKNTIRIYFILFFVLIGCSKESDSETPSEINTETKKYSLTVTASPSDGGGVNLSSGTFEEGKTVSLQGTPNEFYGFKEWTGSIQSTDNPV